MTTVLPVVAPPPAGGYPYLPRLSIEHKTNALLFNDVALDTERRKMIILLGGVRTRTMFNWSEEPGERGLECESKDFVGGNPTERFPWEESNFDKEYWDGTSPLDCGSCIFANWTSDPTARRKSQPARCIEQVAAVFLVPTAISPFPLESRIAVEYVPATMIFQKSAIGKVNDYLKRFKIKKSPPYATLTQVGLDANLGSDFSYSVPKLTSHGEVEWETYPLLSEILQAGRELLVRPTPVVTKPTGFFGEVESKTDTVYSGTFFS